MTSSTEALSERSIDGAIEFSGGSGHVPVQRQRPKVGGPRHRFTFSCFHAFLIECATICDGEGRRYRGPMGCASHLGTHRVFLIRRGRPDGSATELHQTRPGTIGANLDTERSGPLRPDSIEE
jgi:hypothetical protein